MNNDEKTGLTNLWTAGVLPWQTDRPWYYPEFTRINNQEES